VPLRISSRRMITVGFFLLSALLLIACGYSLFTIYAAWRFFRSALVTTSTLPPVSLFKPLKGASADLYDNLASFCRLDYPVYQLLCGVRDPHDPAIAVVERLQRDFPSCDIVLVVKPEPLGSNAKVDTLHRLMRTATHDIFVISDSDVRVEPTYLRAIIPPLTDARVGLVTCAYRGGAKTPFPALFESLIINTVFSPLVIVASQVEKTTYAFGATMAVKRNCVDAIGGFPAIADYLADDYYLGHLVSKAGYEARIVSHVVETNPGVTSLRELFHHQLRWARTQRNCRPTGHCGTLVTFGTVWAVLGWLLYSGSPLIELLSWSTLLFRLLSVSVVSGVFLRSSLTLKSLWAVPFVDLFSFFIWGASLWGNTVRWGEHIFRVQRDGKMIRVRELPAV
jgi:ceramide glucosyltransferase